AAASVETCVTRQSRPSGAGCRAACARCACAGSSSTRRIERVRSASLVMAYIDDRAGRVSRSSQSSGTLRRELAHDGDQLRLPFEPDAGKLGHHDVPPLDVHAVGEATERLEEIGIALVAAEAEPRGDVERHLMPAMRDT